jgi:hypothetical protein
MPFAGPYALEMSARPTIGPVKQSLVRFPASRQSIVRSLSSRDSPEVRCLKSKDFSRTYQVKASVKNLAALP